MVAASLPGQFAGLVTASGPANMSFGGNMILPCGGRILVGGPWVPAIPSSSPGFQGYRTSGLPARPADILVSDGTV